MIEKLQTWQRPLPNNPIVVENIGMDNQSLFCKINELVDAVNALVYENSNDSDWYDGNHIANTSKKVDIGELAKKAEKECLFNPLQADKEVYKALTSAENMQDKFAEQRKWIGKMCWFWNNDNEPDTCFGVLTGLFDEADRPFERSIGQQLYRYCEPIKPDDDIIYKGDK